MFAGQYFLLAAAVGVLLASLPGCQDARVAVQPMSAGALHDFSAASVRAWPVVQSLPQPGGLRPCCAFGYDLKAEVNGVPVPFYNLDNIAEADQLGRHRYNDSTLYSIGSLAGLGREKVGIVYTRHGGFIDVAHVRDSADYTLFLFSQIYQHLGEDWQLPLGDEMASRQLRLFAADVPADAQQRYVLSAYLAADIAYQLACWHEIAQWYGYRSLPMFSEEISGFSPEDLYSNLLGTRLALAIIFQGNAGSKQQFAAAIDQLLPPTLHALGAVNAEQTCQAFDRVDGIWWDSRRRVPDKWLVLYRSYNLASDLYPAPPPSETAAPLRLALPLQWDGYRLSRLGGLYLLPTNSMGRLPAMPPGRYWTVDDFQPLADQAKAVDDQQLQPQPLSEVLSH